MMQGNAVTVLVSDLDRAIDYYANTLGFPLAGRWGDECARIHLENGPVSGLRPMTDPPAPKPAIGGPIQIGVTVDRSLDDVVSDLRSRGVVFRGNPVDEGLGRRAYFADPDGNQLYILETNKCPVRFSRMLAALLSILGAVIFFAPVFLVSRRAALDSAELVSGLGFAILVSGFSVGVAVPETEIDDSNQGRRQHIGLLLKSVRAIRQAA